MVECLVVSQARDGSTSLRDIIQGFFALNGAERPFNGISPHHTAIASDKALRDFGYVTDTFRLWPAIRRHILHGDGGPLYSILGGWRHKVEVSHGLAFVLPAARAVFGRKVRVVRVVREREDHVRSLTNQSQIDPEHWIGYVDADTDQVPEDEKVVRPTAVDFGEATLGEWTSMSTRRRFEWFVDKQTSLTDRNIRLFSDILTISTEAISDSDTIAALGHFIDRDWKRRPMPVHVHKIGNADVAGMSAAGKRHLEHVWQQFDADMAMRDPGYALTFVLAELRTRMQNDPNRVSDVLQSSLRSAGLGDLWSQRPAAAQPGQRSGKVDD